MSRRSGLFRRAPRAMWVAVVLVLAACGGDDDAADTTTTVADDIPAVETSSQPDADEPEDDEPDGEESDGDGTEDTSGTTEESTTDGDDNSMPSVPHDEGIDDPPVAVADLTAVDGGTDEVLGRFEAVIETPGELCVALQTDQTTLTGVHVHIGAAGESGDVLVDVTDRLLPERDEDWLHACQPIDETVESAFVNSTDALYVDVHTPDRPDGALRGQLAAATLFDLDLR